MVFLFNPKQNVHLCVCVCVQEWGMSQDLMVEMITSEGLNTWLEKGISNVAYLSIGLGLDNLASQAFIEAKVSLHTYIHTLCC